MDAQRAFGAHRAAAGVAHRSGGSDHGVAPCGQRPGVFQAAGCRHDQLSFSGRERAAVVHAHAMFGSTQVDVAGIHAAERCHIDGAHRRTIGGALVRRDLRVISTDRIEPGGEPDLFGPQLRMYAHCTGDDVGIRGVIGLQAQPLKADHAAVDAIAFQVALPDDGRAGGHGGALGVDETAARAGDAGRVGDDHLRRVACHLDEAAQVAGVRCVDLVDDDLRATAGHPRIASDIAAQFGLAGATRVIEDDSASIHIKTPVAVDRQALGVGLPDVHHGHAVGGLEHHRLLFARRVAVCQDLRMCHALPRQCQGQDQRAELPRCRCHHTGSPACHR